MYATRVQTITNQASKNNESEEVAQLKVKIELEEAEEGGSVPADGFDDDDDDDEGGA